MHTVSNATHTAYLDALAGVGLMVLPHPCDDVSLSGPVSLHHADWDSMIRKLRALGFEPTEDEDGGLIVDSHTRDGREIIALCSERPICEGTDLLDMVEASSALLTYAISR